MANTLIADYIVQSVWNLDEICKELGITYDDIDQEQTYVKWNVLNICTKDGRWFDDIKPDMQDAQEAAMDGDFKYPMDVEFVAEDN